jgi:hypothetical protein
MLGLSKSAESIQERAAGQADRSARDRRTAQIRRWVVDRTVAHPDDVHGNDGGSAQLEVDINAEETAVRTAAEQERLKKLTSEADTAAPARDVVKQPTKTQNVKEFLRSFAESYGSGPNDDVVKLLKNNVDAAWAFVHGVYDFYKKEADNIDEMLRFNQMREAAEDKVIQDLKSDPEFAFSLARELPKLADSSWFHDMDRFEEVVQIIERAHTETNKKEAEEAAAEQRVGVRAA